MTQHIVKPQPLQQAEIENGRAYTSARQPQTDKILRAPRRLIVTLILIAQAGEITPAVDTPPFGELNVSRAVVMRTDVVRHFCCHYVSPWSHPWP